MNILVVSDSHGNTELLKDIISRNRAWCDLVIHLGDNMLDINEVIRDFSNIAHLGVLGNCDFASMYSNAKTEGSFTAEKRRIFYTHGHKYNVNHGLDLLAFTAKFNKADIALYGHTHVAFCEEINGVLVVNPGSISSPRDGSGGTYAKITIKEDKADCKIVEVNT